MGCPGEHAPFVSIDLPGDHCDDHLIGSGGDQF